MKKIINMFLVAAALIISQVSQTFAYEANIITPGYRNIPINDIILEESEAGAFKPDGYIYVRAEHLTFENNVKYRVARGNVKVKNVTVDGSVIRIAILTESTKPSRIVLSGLTMYVPSSLSDGSYPLELVTKEDDYFKDNIFAKTYGNNNDADKFNVESIPLINDFVIIKRPETKPPERMKPHDGFLANDISELSYNGVVKTNKLPAQLPVYKLTPNKEEITFDEPVELLGYKLNSSAGYDEYFKAAVCALQANPNVIFDMDNPTLVVDASVSSGDGLPKKTTVAYDKTDDDIQNLINYSFNNVEFIGSNDGKLEKIVINRPNMEETGRYALISKDDAKKALLSKEFITTVQDNYFPGELYLQNRVDLVYKRNSLNCVAPYYRFCAELPNNGLNGLKDYAFYYVSAIDKFTLKKLGLWDGTIVADR